MTLVLLLAWQACAPEVQAPPRRVALEAWYEARDAAQSGAPDEALRLVENALAAQPDDVNLLTWRAEWLAQSGKTGEAEAQLSDVLARSPLYDEARYRRAVLRAGAGDVEGSAADARWLLEHRAVTKKSLRAEAAWSALLDRPEFDFLAAAPPAMTVRYRERGMYAGTDFSVSVAVRGEDLEGLDVRASVTGPARWMSTEERWFTVQGEPALDAEFWFRATGPGTLVQGPVTASTASGVITREALPLTIEGVQRDGERPVEPVALSLPSKLLRRIDEDARWLQNGEGLWIILGEGEEVSWTPSIDARPRVHTVVREEQPTVRLLQYDESALPAAEAVFEWGRPGGAAKRHTWTPR